MRMYKCDRSREFWKDNKKHSGDVCEECRDEVDVSNVCRRKSRGSNVVGG